MQWSGDKMDQANNIKIDEQALDDGSTSTIDK